MLRTFSSLLTWLAIAGATALPGDNAQTLLARASDPTAFNWTGITSSPTLTWTSCYGAFQCSKFTVPLQYLNPSAGEAQIALIMSPSDYSHDDPSYLGPILFNPGGPGVSGVDYILEDAAYFRAIIGPQYDLVGFDPRGIGQTTPILSIFDTPAEALEFFSSYPGNANESVSSLGRAYAQSLIFGDLAADRAKTVMESVGSPAVATDMLGIVRAFGYEKLNYWGISYGSVLGATFAAMYPNNVGRLIIDGVFNAEDWYAGNGTSSLLDTDAALTSYYTACAAAGPALCALYEPTPAAVHARVAALLDAVHTQPVPLYNTTGVPGVRFAVADFTLAVQQLFQATYYPFSTGPAVAAGLAALEKGNASALFQGSETADIDALVPASTAASPTTPVVVGLLDNVAPVLCGDSATGAIKTFAESKKAYEEMLEVSEFATAWYDMTQGICAGWTIQAKDRLNGSFVTNTSSPILLISNTHDPVTPILGGRRMSEGFHGSVLLQQNSTGHTSLSGFSTCTAQAIYAYFASGTLPAPGTVCQTDTQPFENPGNSSAFGGISLSGSAFSERAEGGWYVQRSGFLERNSLVGRMMRVGRWTRG